MKNRRITREVLLENGFEDTGETHGYSPIFRKKVEGYAWQFQFILGDYPDSNPNSGVLGLYHPKEMIKGVPEDLYQKENWTAEDIKRAENHEVEWPESLTNIAFHVVEEDRLLRIIDDLTYKIYADAG